MSRHQSRREAGYRKHVPDASPVRTAAGRAQADDGPSHTSCVGPSKPASQPRGEKTKDKSEDRFESHCSDSLALACAVGMGEPVEPGPFLAVDDSYRAVRRRLHDTQPGTGGIREPYSTGTVSGLRKGLLIGTPRGPGRLCGINKGALRYYDRGGKRRSVKATHWISPSFVTRRKDGDSPVA